MGQPLSSWMVVHQVNSADPEEIEGSNPNGDNSLS